MKANLKYSDDEDKGGFEEEYIDDDYEDVKKPTQQPIPQNKAQVKNDFWEPPSLNNKSTKPLQVGGMKMNS
jgi:hypothetical protein